MTPTWLVQSNLISEDTLAVLSAACNKLGYDCRGVKIIPFTDSPEFLLDPLADYPGGPIIPYGSTSMIKSFARSKLDKRGFFFCDANLRTSVWVDKLDDRILNYDSLFMTLEEAFNLDMFGTTFFMKPDNDLKDFCGTLVSAQDIEKFYTDVSAGGFCFKPDIPVVLSPVKQIGWEYRLFMIQDRVIAKSSYRYRTMLSIKEPVPQEVVDFAEETARIWFPDYVYVMDICETENGYKIVEFNTFNASGFYACNVEDIVREVSEFVATRT